MSRITIAAALLALAEKVPIGIPLPDLTMDQFMDLEDSWSTREDRV
jgi:hypothetical protein